MRAEIERVRGLAYGAEKGDRNLLLKCLQEEVLWDYLCSVSPNVWADAAQLGRLLAKVAVGGTLPPTRNPGAARDLCLAVEALTKATAPQTAAAVARLDLRKARLDDWESQVMRAAAHAIWRLHPEHVSEPSALSYDRGDTRFGQLAMSTLGPVLNRGSFLEVNLYQFERMRSGAASATPAHRLQVRYTPQARVKWTATVGAALLEGDVPDTVLAANANGLLAEVLLTQGFLLTQDVFEQL